MAIKIDKEQCIGCESCVATCPTGALSMEDGKANVNEDTCVSCGACVGECPVGAISLGGAAEKKEAAEGKDLWVMVELENGEPVGVTYELLGVAADLAQPPGQRPVPPQTASLLPVAPEYHLPLAVEGQHGFGPHSRRKSRQSQAFGFGQRTGAHITLRGGREEISPPFSESAREIEVEVHGVGVGLPQGKVLGPAVDRS